MTCIKLTKNQLMWSTPNFRKKTINVTHTRNQYGLRTNVAHKKSYYENQHMLQKMNVAHNNRTTQCSFGLWCYLQLKSSLSFSDPPPKQHISLYHCDSNQINHLVEWWSIPSQKPHMSTLLVMAHNGHLLSDYIIQKNTFVQKCSYEICDFKHLHKNKI